MSVSLSVTTSSKDGVMIFHLGGNLDAASEEILCQQAQKAYDDGAKFLLLDLHHLEFISSAGLRALHKIFKLCTPDGELQAMRAKQEPYKSPYFKLAGATSKVYSVINIAGFLQNIPIYPSTEEALASFEE